MPSVSIYPYQSIFINLDERCSWFNAAIQNHQADMSDWLVIFYKNIFS